MSISEDGLRKNQANFASLSPLSFLERTRKTFPNQTAIEYKDYKLSYKQAGQRCDALANLIKNQNFKLIGIFILELVSRSFNLQDNT